MQHGFNKTQRVIKLDPIREGLYEVIEENNITGTIKLDKGNVEVWLSQKNVVPIS